MGNNWTFEGRTETIMEEWKAIQQFLPTTWRFRDTQDE